MSFLSVPANRQLSLGTDGEIDSVALFAPEELVESMFPYRSAALTPCTTSSSEIVGIDLVKQWSFELAGRISRGVSSRCCRRPRIAPKDCLWYSLV
jgi:hypothetical protein